eukprot:CAMPEP_0202455308 /NCGR_PEP_ID=MMETSP1360-20130828/12876_1 /ASSEMBLY_ACC=CAM_ASM_000848 /TAXON_ID=515479 /ORGANISM="Licmophora paradoxa, Strain CCMP2313" /LENGTH=198 /DNA_ID=CAMNT_0049074869 /DNA_START=216 /DNA_END=812 /DNA_ORIENTATION=+
MKAVLPSDTLMAITIRNPVDRAFSHFAHFAGCDREKYTKHDKPQCFHDLVTSEMQRLEQCFTILGELNIECIHNPLNAVNKGARLVGLGLYAVFFQLWYQHFPNLCVMDVVSHGKNLEPAAHEFEQCLGISRTDARGVKDNYGVDWKNISHISQAQKFEPMYDLTRRMLEEFYKPYNQMLCHMVPHTCEWEWVRKSFD